MKAYLLLPALVATSPLLQAEPPAGASPSRPSSAQLSEENQKPRDRMPPHIPPELRQRFEAARDKVMKDPALQELRKKADLSAEEFRKAMREAIMKVDPGLAEILKDRMGEKPPGAKDGRRDGGFADLSEGDRQRLMAAREIAKSDPVVQAAHAKKESAQSPEERRAAGKEFHKAMKEALLKADPSLGTIIEQLKPPQGRPPVGPAMPGTPPGGG